MAQNAPHAASAGLAIFTAIESFHSYVYRVEPDVNDACRWVHLLLILGQMTSKYTLGIAIFMHHVPQWWVFFCWWHPFCYFAIHISPPIVKETSYLASNPFVPRYLPFIISTGVVFFLGDIYGWFSFGIRAALRDGIRTLGHRWRRC